MCGRFAMIESEKKLIREFKIQYSKILLEPRYNIRPSQDIPVIVQQDGLSIVESMQWGLIPFWAKKPKPIINARAETVTEKLTFRQSFRKRRCLIPSSGFFEWTKENGVRKPYFICLKNKSPMSFAGIWEEWSFPDGKIVNTCAILTVKANSYLQLIHHRMPVILTPTNGMNWLDLDVNKASLINLLKPFNSENILAWRVTRQVNSSAFDNPNCIEILDE